MGWVRGGTYMPATPCHILGTNFPSIFQAMDAQLPAMVSRPRPPPLPLTVFQRLLYRTKPMKRSKEPANCRAPPSTAESKNGATVTSPTVKLLVRRSGARKITPDRPNVKMAVASLKSPWGI
jgi:hypothetical protein